MEPRQKTGPSRKELDAPFKHFVLQDFRFALKGGGGGDEEEEGEGEGCRS